MARSLRSSRLNRRGVIQLPLPRLLFLRTYSRPSRTPVKGPVENEQYGEQDALMKLVVHVCKVDHSHWNYDVIHLVQKMGSVAAEPRKPAERRISEAP